MERERRQTWVGVGGDRMGQREGRREDRRVTFSSVQAACVSRSWVSYLQSAPRKSKCLLSI